MSLRNKSVLLSVMLSAGCYGGGYTPPGFTPSEFSNPYKGLVYSKSKETMKVYNANSGPSARGGHVCNKSLFGLVSWGSQSVDEAQMRGGLKEIHKIEVVRAEILGGLASEQCLVVRGE